MTMVIRLPRLRSGTNSSVRGVCRQFRAQYHSNDHPAPPGPFNEVELRILSSSLPYIPTHGFTVTALHHGAKAAGYLDVSTNLFPAGAFSLIHYHLHTQRQKLRNNADIINPRPDPDNKVRMPGVGQKVKALTWARLMANGPVIHKYPEALALMSLVGNVPTSLRELSALADEIWFLAGDVSVDSSWYTKRGTLSAIYGLSEVFMTTDKTEGFKETREFLERRFEDSRVLGETAGNVGQWVDFAARSAMNVLRSKGVRI